MSHIYPIQVVNCISSATTSGGRSWVYLDRPFPSRNVYKNCFHWRTTLCTHVSMATQRENLRMFILSPPDTPRQRSVIKSLQPVSIQVLLWHCSTFMWSFTFFTNIYAQHETVKRVGFNERKKKRQQIRQEITLIERKHFIY